MSFTFNQFSRAMFLILYSFNPIIIGNLHFSMHTQQWNRSGLILNQYSLYKSISISKWKSIRKKTWRMGKMEWKLVDNVLQVKWFAFILKFLLNFQIKCNFHIFYLPVWFIAQKTSNYHLHKIQLFNRRENIHSLLMATM